jgi:hypothetical protein
MAIGDWDDTRNAAVYQQVVEHEEFDLTAENQWRLLVGHDRVTCGAGEEWLSFNSASWTEADWYSLLTVRPGQAWDCLAAWIYVNANSGTNYLRVEVRDAYDNAITYLPNSSGVTVSGTGWLQVAKCVSPTWNESVISMHLAIMGRCPSGSMEVGYLLFYLNSTLEP